MFAIQQFKLRYRRVSLPSSIPVCCALRSDHEAPECYLVFGHGCEPLTASDILGPEGRVNRDLRTPLVSPLGIDCAANKIQKEIAPWLFGLGAFLCRDSVAKLPAGFVVVLRLRQEVRSCLRHLLVSVSCNVGHSVRHASAVL